MFCDSFATGSLVQDLKLFKFLVSFYRDNSSDLVSNYNWSEKLVRDSNSGSVSAHWSDLAVQLVQVQFWTGSVLSLVRQQYRFKFRFWTGSDLCNWSRQQFKFRFWTDSAHWRVDVLPPWLNMMMNDIEKDKSDIDMQDNKGFKTNEKQDNEKVSLEKDIGNDEVLGLEIVFTLVLVDSQDIQPEGGSVEVDVGNVALDFLEIDLGIEEQLVLGMARVNADSSGKKRVDCSMSASCGAASNCAAVGVPTGVQVADFGVATSKDGKGGCRARQVGGVYVLLYKLGDDIPFDEDVLNHLLAESAVILGMDVRHISGLFYSSVFCNWFWFRFGRLVQDFWLETAELLISRLASSGLSLVQFPGLASLCSLDRTGYWTDWLVSGSVVISGSGLDRTGYWSVQVLFTG
ncbi:hypothetical protein L7F22_044655 [Adiantum nelumboides]|nr:hypothetical protein [Adiantum nelumboides]